MNEEITDVKPPMGFPHITDLAGSEATILQVANSQGDILGYATLNDIDAYIEQKVSETVHSFSQKQIFQDVTINGTFDGNNVVNQSKLNGALRNLITFYDISVKSDEWGNGGTWLSLNDRIPILAQDQTEANNQLGIWVTPDSDIIRISGLSPNVTHLIRIYCIIH